MAHVATCEKCGDPVFIEGEEAEHGYCFGVERDGKRWCWNDHHDCTKEGED